jgi:hypothetical protein
LSASSEEWIGLFAGCDEMDTLAIFVLLIGIWLVVDALIGIWRTRNLFFAWQLIGISFIRMPLEILFHENGGPVPMWSMLLGLLGTFGLIVGLTAATISLLTDARAITNYLQAKQGRGLLRWLLCIYQPAKEEIALNRS